MRFNFIVTKISYMLYSVLQLAIVEPDSRID